MTHFCSFKRWLRNKTIGRYSEESHSLTPNTRHFLPKLIVSSWSGYFPPLTKHNT